MENRTLISSLENLIGTAEKFRSSYFWNPPQSACARRSYERQHSIPEISWTENGHNYTAEFSVDCSCRNIYAKGRYTRDGDKTTLTAIKNSYKRMSEKLGAMA